MSLGTRGNPISAFGVRPSFGLRTSDFHPPQYCYGGRVGLNPRRLLPAALLSLALSPSSLLACAACAGQSDSAMAQGMNWGIFSMIGVVVLVLGGVAGFFIYLARRSAALAAQAAEPLLPLVNLEHELE